MFSRNVFCCRCSGVEEIKSGKSERTVLLRALGVRFLSGDGDVDVVVKRFWRALGILFVEKITVFFSHLSRR